MFNIGIYVIADSHFNHYRIIEYCNRPWKTIDNMNNQLIINWNSVITEEDIVWVFGDFGFGSMDSLQYILNQLKGDKKLLLGNHDRRRSVNWWLNVGFSEVIKDPFYMYDNVIVSHEPLDISPDIINIHGHIHNTPLPDAFSEENHICVSVELIDYRPILLDSLVL